MKLTKVLPIIVLALTQLSQAEVRPKLPGGGEILDTACGNINKSVSVCLAQAVNSKAEYLVIRHFLRSETYIPVTRVNKTPRGLVGSSTNEFTGRAAVIGVDKKTASENLYILKTQEAVVPNATKRATLSVNGVVDAAGSFEMERISHSE